jgi:hypothetical protein
MRVGYRSIAALVAVLAVAAVGTSTAAAHEFTASKAPGTLVLKGSGTQVFELGSTTIKCSTMTGSGSIGALKFHSQAVDVAYEKCASNGGEVPTFKAEYEVLIEEALKLTNPVLITVGSCTLKLLAETRTKLTFSNGSGTIDVAASVKELEWVNTCGGSGSTGLYLGSFALEETAGGSLAWV